MVFSIHNVNFTFRIIIPSPIVSEICIITEKVNFGLVT